MIGETAKNTPIPSKKYVFKKSKTIPADNSEKCKYASVKKVIIKSNT